MTKDRAMGTAARVTTWTGLVLGAIVGLAGVIVLDGGAVFGVDTLLDWAHKMFQLGLLVAIGLVVVGMVVALFGSIMAIGCWQALRRRRWSART